MAKDKSKKRKVEDAEEAGESTVKTYLSPFAVPLADKKLTKKLLKVSKKAHSSKHVLRGIKDTVKAIRKGQTGVVLIAGNVSPDDVITHLPVLCEDASIPYIFVPSKEALGESAGTKRATSALFISPGGKGNKNKDFDYQEIFDEAILGIKEIA